MTIVVNAFEIVTTTVRERKYYMNKKKIMYDKCFNENSKEGGSQFKKLELWLQQQQKQRSLFFRLHFYN